MHAYIRSRWKLGCTVVPDDEVWMMKYGNIRTYIHKHIHIHTYTYMYTHTYIHAEKNSNTVPVRSAYNLFKLYICDLLRGLSFQLTKRIEPEVPYNNINTYIHTYIHT